LEALVNEYQSKAKILIDNYLDQASYSGKLDKETLVKDIDIIIDCKNDAALLVVQKYFNKLFFTMSNFEGEDI